MDRGRNVRMFLGAYVCIEATTYASAVFITAVVFIKGALTVSGCLMTTTDGRSIMNLYFWLILFLSIVFLAYGAFRGYKNGFVKEVEGLVAIVFSVVCLVLVSGLTRGAIGENISSKALAIALLIVIGALYSLCRIIFSSLKLFAGLPVIRILDQLLGLFAGGAKVFMLLYVVDHIAKIWLNL